MTVPSSGKCLHCIGSFRAAIATLKERGDGKEVHLIDKTRDELDRFTLWAGNIGALNVPTSPLSLEYRLRDAKDILTHIIELLNDLHEAASDLQNCLAGQGAGDGPPPGDEKAEDEGEEDEGEEDEAEALVAEAGSYITRLFRVTKIIRQAAPTDRFMKALSRERLKLDDHFDVSHVGAKFPKLAVDNQVWLRQRLGRAITHRRQFLRYTREHRDKLESSGVDDALMMETESRLDGSRLPEDGAARGEGASRPSTFFTKATTIDPVKISSLPLPLDQESDAEDDAKSYTTISRSVDGDLDTSLSDRVPKLRDLQIALELERSPIEPEPTNRTLVKFAVLEGLAVPESLREDGVDPVTMDKSTSHLSSMLGKLTTERAMKIQRDYVEFQARKKREIECPFCCEIKKIKDEKAWRRHVYADLRPYVCTFADCSKPYFGDLNEWFNHEMQSHRVSYACQLCQGKLYSSDKQYLDHVRRRHPALLVGGGEQALLDIAKQPVQQISAEDCPCCIDWTDRLRLRLPDIDASEPIHVTPAVFKRHLASHLEQLALFALPLPTSENDGQDSKVAVNVESEDDIRSVATWVSFTSEEEMDDGDRKMDADADMYSLTNDRDGESDPMYDFEVLGGGEDPEFEISILASATRGARAPKRVRYACIPCRSRRVVCDLFSRKSYDAPCDRCRREGRECFFSSEHPLHSTQAAQEDHSTTGPQDDQKAKERLERLRSIEREEQLAFYQQAMPDIKMTVEQWSETAEKLQRYASDMAKIGRALSRWYEATEDDDKVRLFFRMRHRILQQFADGEEMSVLKDTFSIDCAELDQSWALLEGMPKDLARRLFGRNMMAVSAHQSEDGVQEPQAAAQPGTPQMSAQSHQSQSSQAAPRNAADLEQNFKAPVGQEELSDDWSSSGSGFE